MAKYVVIAPYVTLTTNTVEGRRVLGFHAGAPVPADVDQDVIDRHVEAGMIAKVPEPPAPRAPAAKAPPGPGKGG